MGDVGPPSDATHSTLASFKRLFSSRKKEKDQPSPSWSEGVPEQNGHQHQPTSNDGTGEASASSSSSFHKAPSKWFGRKTFSRSKAAGVNQPRRPPKPVPALHACAMQGDLPGVLEAITSGADVNETVEMDNMQGHVLEGVSALFLAAQKNKTKLVKLLVENGADPGAKVYFSETKEHCTPAQIAALNMNAKLALYLKKAKKNAKKNGVTFPRHHPTNGGRAQGQAAVPTAAGAQPRSAYAPESYPPSSYAPQSQIASDDALSDQATSIAPESRRATTDGVDRRRMPRSSQAGSSDLPPAVEGEGWNSFYLNPGFNMDMRSPELEDDDDKIDLNVQGLESRREHLRNLLNQSA